jgi:hypothetical protein
MARNSELESASHTRPHFVLPLALSSHDGGLNLAIPLMTP